MKKTLMMAVVASMVVLANGASAATFNYVATISGNDCKGFRGFERCSYDGMSTVAKFNYKRGVETSTRLNTRSFPTIDGSEFDVSLTTRRSGSWSYSPTGVDPVITAFIVKAGRKHSVFVWDRNSGDDFSSILWNTLNLGNRALSHITFFGIESEVRPGPSPTTVPVPAAGLLLIAGLGSLIGLRRRRKS